MSRPTIPSPVSPYSANRQSGVTLSTTDSSLGSSTKRHTSALLHFPTSSPADAPVRSPTKFAINSPTGSVSMLVTTPPRSFPTDFHARSPKTPPTSIPTDSCASSTTTCSAFVISRASTRRSVEGRLVKATKDKEQLRWERPIDIHSDGRFMSALRAMQTPDHQPIVSRRRTNVNTNTTIESAHHCSITPSTPEKTSPSPVKRRPRRRLQRSQAFMIDRSPSPSGRVCEIETNHEPEQDELCALFKSKCGGIDED
ncbi:hypothetical protein IWZ01DRAFT_484650 [Phyllosticta capitalensis]